MASKKKCTPPSKARQTHYVRVKLDYILRFDQKQRHIPRELNPFHATQLGKGLIQALIIKGLNPQFRKSKRTNLVALMPHARIDVRLFFPRQTRRKTPSK